MASPRHALLTMAAAASLAAGCTAGGEQTAFFAPAQTVPLTRRSGALLYVAAARGGSDRAPGYLSIFAFPRGNIVMSQSLSGSPSGLCADRDGNVWVLELEHRGWGAVEYAHGGKRPIANVRVGNIDVAEGCAVDPASGALAIFTGVDSSHQPQPVVEIWAIGHDAKPRGYPLPFTPTAGTYDASGNLFVDGYVGGNETFDFAELPNGGETFSPLTIDRHTESPGGLQWDGANIVLETGGLGRRSAIYRLSVSGGVAHVVGTVVPKDMCGGSAIAVSGNAVAGTTGTFSDRVALWPYPSGGASTTSINRFKYAPRGLAISTDP